MAVTICAGCSSRGSKEYLREFSCEMTGGLYGNRGILSEAKDISEGRLSNSQERSTSGREEFSVILPASEMP